MGRKTFQITWNGNSIVYDPSSGSIQNASTKEVRKIDKNPQSRFPDFAKVPSGLLRRKYKPFCLTIYPNHRCNLACSYCYVSQKRDLSADEINHKAIQAGAEIVATNCGETGMPFILGFHGGNEPLLKPERIHHCIEICRNAAAPFGLEVLPFCTTNGAIPETTARWAAQNFYGITLSWDGPSDLHDRFRRQANGTATSAMVRRTAAIFLNAANGLKQFKVRATITSAAVNRLLEIVQYFYEERIKWVEFYPVFQNDTKPLFADLMPNAGEFVKNFLIAGKWAKPHGMTVGYAGSRLTDFHDKYCPVYQNNLTITPDGYLTACFQATHNHEQQNDPYLYGHFDARRGKIIIDWKKLESIFAKLAPPYAPCVNCFNYLHCAKCCPAICPIRDGAAAGGKLECTMEKWIGLANIIEAAGYEISDDEIQNCASFFSNILVEKISQRRDHVRI
jgi:uncharacterized protein